jgi:hypothetical protein
MAASASSVGGQELQRHQDDLIRQAERLVSLRASSRESRGG